MGKVKKQCKRQVLGYPNTWRLQNITQKDELLGVKAKSRVGCMTRSEFWGLSSFLCKF